MAQRADQRPAKDLQVGKARLLAISDGYRAWKPDGSLLNESEAVGLIHRGQIRPKPGADIKRWFFVAVPTEVGYKSAIPEWLPNETLIPVEMLPYPPPTEVAASTPERGAIESDDLPQQSIPGYAVRSFRSEFKSSQLMESIGVTYETGPFHLAVGDLREGGSVGYLNSFGPKEVAVAVYFNELPLLRGETHLVACTKDGTSFEPIGMMGGVDTAIYRFAVDKKHIDHFELFGREVHRAEFENVQLYPFGLHLTRSVRT